MARQEIQAKQAQRQQQSQITENGQPILTNGITPSIQDTLETETIAIDCRNEAVKLLQPKTNQYLRSHGLGEDCFAEDQQIKSTIPAQGCNRWFLCEQRLGTSPGAFP